MSTVFYLRTEQPPNPSLILPSDYLASFGVGHGNVWQRKNAAYGGANARSLDTVTGNLQQEIIPTWSSIANNAFARIAVAQFCSQPLATKTYAASNWACAFAVKFNNQPGSGTQWSPSMVAFLVNGTTGALKSTILATDADTPISPGATNRPSPFGSSEETCYENPLSSPSSGFTAANGDYIVLEIGVRITNSTGGPGDTFTPNTSHYTSGITKITNDLVGTTDAQSFLSSNLDIQFLLNARNNKTSMSQQQLGSPVALLNTTQSNTQKSVFVG